MANHSGIKYILVFAVFAFPLLTCGNPLAAASLKGITVSGLQMNSRDSALYSLGASLGQSAFCYSALNKRAVQALTEHSAEKRSNQLRSLFPLARIEQASAERSLIRARSIATSLGAPKSFLSKLDSYVLHLTSQDNLIKTSGVLGERDVKSTLDAVQNYQLLLPLPQSKSLQSWMSSTSNGASGHVWYSEGVFMSVASIAASDQLPELLPKTSDVATEVKGLSGLITTLLPDNPTSRNVALQRKLVKFLNWSSQKRVANKRLSRQQLFMLGTIAKDVDELLVTDSEHKSSIDLANLKGFALSQA